MNEPPRQPREKATCTQQTSLQYRVILADNGHVTLVEMTERTFGDHLPFSSCAMSRPTYRPFLYRRLRDAGDRAFVFA